MLSVSKVDSVSNACQQLKDKLQSAASQETQKELLPRGRIQTGKCLFMWGIETPSCQRHFRHILNCFVDNRAHSSRYRYSPGALLPDGEVTAYYLP